VPFKAGDEWTKCAQCHERLQLTDLKIGEERWKEIKGLKIVCPNKGGCDWTGTYRELVDNHVFKECKFMDVECRWCRKLINRLGFDAHLSECGSVSIPCSLCLESYLRRHRVMHLQHRHQDKIEICGVCKTLVVSAQMDKHKRDDDCKEAILSCPYSSIIGCTFKGVNSALQEHNSSHEIYAMHLALAMERFALNDKVQQKHSQECKIYKYFYKNYNDDGCPFQNIGCIFEAKSTDHKHEHCISIEGMAMHLALALGLTSERNLALLRHMINKHGHSKSESMYEKWVCEQGKMVVALVSKTAADDEDDNEDTDKPTPDDPDEWR
jgi:hypothetical protein